MEKISDVILNEVKSLNSIVYLIEGETVNSDDSAPEKKLLCSIIEKAVDDLSEFNKKLSSLDRDKLLLLRDAFIWLFLERKNNIELIYDCYVDNRLRKITITGFDSYCDWAGIDPIKIRKQLLKNYKIPIRFID